jgi:4-alpha-glucanotransferase
MKILFHLEYQTTFGEELAVNIIKDGKTEQYKMGTLDGYHWTYELSKTAKASHID